MRGNEVALPRYKFVDTKVGCTNCGVQDCLCDVVITDPVGMWTGRHQWWNIALDELDDYTVSERNIAEFFSIVLGCEQTYSKMFEQNIIVCEICGKDVPNSDVNQRLTCSQVCRNKKSRMKKKREREQTNAVR